MNRQREKIANYYISELDGIDGLKLPYQDENIKTNWHLFDIHVAAKHKYWIMDALRAEGIYVNVVSF